MKAQSSVSAPWVEQIPPNALRRRRDPTWRGGFSLGVDLGLSRTGLALSKGFAVRPLTVLELRGQKLELKLLDIAENEEVDEFIIGLPKSSDGKETEQSNKVRSVAGRFAVRAAERGWRVYLQDEHGTSAEALGHMIAKLTTVVAVAFEPLGLLLIHGDGGEVDEFIIGLPKSSDGKETEQSNKVRSVAGRFAVRAAERGWRVYLQDEHGTSAEALGHMIAKGIGKSARHGKIDAYAAMNVLERYFSYLGEGVELVVPKQVELQDKLRKGPPKDVDFFPEEQGW
ncbi:putative holliday junction resolvase [Phtheirospermum japonicum]|uniref:Putative holliday junction resolvase n=1 Tax=Phtheirospermum japonicum TaxID=374723 RepID=A0A830CVV6_9LAMI|nr:putative holliday junction resolvase [Phtheirospermum japonicum]